MSSGASRAGEKRLIEIRRPNAITSPMSIIPNVEHRRVYATHTQTKGTEWQGNVTLYYISKYGKVYRCIMATVMRRYRKLCNRAI